MKMQHMESNFVGSPLHENNYISWFVDFQLDHEDKDDSKLSPNGEVHEGNIKIQEFLSNHRILLWVKWHHGTNYLL